MSLEFRTARPDEFGLLDEMTMAGVRHWGHHENYPDAYQGLAALLAANPPDDSRTIEVLEADGEVVAFYDLQMHEDHIELLRMFQDPERIGTGLGRILWDRATSQACLTADRMLIMSDPKATGFYEAMGAIQEDSMEASPGFVLGVLWYDLG